MIRHYNHKLIIVFLFLFTITQASKPIRDRTQTNILPRTYPSENSFSANRFFGQFINDGNLFTYHVGGWNGGRWQYEQGGSMIFQSGFWAIGKAQDGELHSASVQYTSEFLPGIILENGEPADSSLEVFRIFKINAGDTTSEDYLNWPSQYGAPLDASGNPLLLGDQTLWFVCNDADPYSHYNLWGTEPMNIETQYTIFGVDSIIGLEDVVFIKLLIINKGTETFDSTYFGFFNDMDLGSATDDKSGNDTTLQLAYVYNGEDRDRIFGNQIPAVGFQLLQGPIVDSPGDTATFMGRKIPDHKNLKFSSMLYTGCSSGPNVCAETAIEAYHVLQGLAVNGEPFFNPITGEQTTFLVTGDPLTNTGWLDDFSSDKYQYLGIGPLTFAPGDTQEIIFAYIAGEGTNNLNGIASLRAIASMNNNVYKSNFNFDEGVPVKICHRPSNYLEYEPPQISVQTIDGVDIDLSGSYIYFSFNSDSFQQLPLQEVGNGIYSADIGTIYCEAVLRYYFEIRDTEGNVYHAPLAAPSVWYEIIWGPDCTPPEISGEMDTTQTVYRSDFRILSGSLNYLDRFTVDSIFFEYRLPGGDWMPPVFSSFSCKTPWQLDSSVTEIIINWSAGISWDDIFYGNSIEYRLGAADASMRRNIGYSASGIIKISKHEDIADFTDVSPWIPSSYAPWTLDGWVFHELQEAAPWILGVCADENFNNYSDNLNTKFIYGKLFPGSDYASAFLSYNSLCLANTGDTAFVEISSDSITWTPIDWITDRNYSSSNVTPIWRTVQLPVDITEPGYFIRFRFQTDDQSEAYPVGWFINRVQIDVDTSAVNLGPTLPLPLSFRVEQNYPNPFNSSTVITYSLPKAAEVEIRIFSLDGRQISTIKQGFQAKGEHSFIWSPANLPSGVYIYQINAGNYSRTKKCVILK